jgi:hypothetical protein
MKIKLVSKQGHAALIEWTDATGGLHRSIVPVEAITEGRIGLAELDYAIHQDGIDLVAALGKDEITISAQKLQNELRRAGVWTKEDYLAKPTIIFGVLQRLYGVDVATLQNIAIGAE